MHKRTVTEKESLDLSPRIPRKRLRIGDISISYFIKPAEQAKKTVIFIHGFPFNKNSWLPQLQNLDNDVTGIAIDVRGHGRSTTGHGYFSIDVFANDLLVFIKKLELTNVVLCGVFMGGYIALRAYELAPKAFNGLVLSDTHSLPDDNATKIKRFDTIQAVLKHGKRVFALGFTDNVFAYPEKESNAYAVELIKRSIRRNEVRNICATLLALASRTDTTASLKNIEVPVLVIRGALDKITSTAQRDILLSNIPDVNLVEIPECGHLPNLEDPHTFNETLNQFLKHINNNEKKA